MLNAWLYKIHMYIWAWGHMDMWAFEHVDMWVCGHVYMWVCGHVDKLYVNFAHTCSMVLNYFLSNGVNVCVVHILEGILASPSP